MKNSSALFLITVLTLIINLNVNQVCANSSIPDSTLNARTKKTANKTQFDVNRAARKFTENYVGPIIDAHLHLYPAAYYIFDEEYIKEIENTMLSSGVIKAVIMPGPNEGRKPKTENITNNYLIRKQFLSVIPKTIRIFCGSEHVSAWMHRAYREGYSNKDLDEVLTALNRDIQDPDCYGIGEIGVSLYVKYGKREPIQYPLMFEPFEKVVSLIVENDEWLEIHIESIAPDGTSSEKELHEWLAYIYNRHPNLKLILAHMGMVSPESLKSILMKYPNVMSNFKIKLNREGWEHLFPLTNEKGELYEDWAQIFEEMPERFTIGTDHMFGRGSFSYSDNNAGLLTKSEKVDEDILKIGAYKKKINRIRNVLGTIDPKSASMIAYENANNMLKDE